MRRTFPSLHPPGRLEGPPPPPPASWREEERIITFKNGAFRGAAEAAAAPRGFPGRSVAVSVSVLHPKIQRRSQQDNSIRRTRIIIFSASPGDDRRTRWSVGRWSTNNSMCRSLPVVRSQREQQQQQQKRLLTCFGGILVSPFSGRGGGGAVSRAPSSSPSFNLINIYEVSK